MIIENTLIRNFRNFSGPGLRANWDPGINLILGKNGAGKTNLLEALSILTGWGAFGKTSGVISWNTNGRTYLSANFSGEESFYVTAEISSRISLRLNDKSLTFTELRLNVPSIIFLSGSLSLIDGSPSSRRLFIDRLCALFVPPFAKRLADFRNVLRVRSSLLRRGRSPASTDILFCKLGGWIMEIRRKVLAELKRVMTDGKFSFEFVPAMSKTCEEYLREMTEINVQKELYAKRVLSGPNYDDVAITFLENGKAASESLSRGQKRRLILHMIITSGKLIAERLKKSPILLLDDMTAELDSDGRKWVYHELTQTGWQVFLTAPERPFSSRKKFGGINLPAV